MQPPANIGQKLTYSILRVSDMTNGTSITPFRIDIPQAAIDDLRDRLSRRRVPDLPDAGWDRGAPVDVTDELAQYWTTEFDWRAQEVQLNEWPHFLTNVDGQTIHFLHVRSPEPDATPLLLVHGWPASFLEFVDSIGPLTNPRAHGSDLAEAFHVVIPSIPGFAFSSPLRSTGWGSERIAAAFVELMARLGYDRYGVQGDDIGSLVAPEMAKLAPKRVVGVHVNALLTYPIGVEGEMDGLTDEEQQRWRTLEAFNDGYLQIQSKSPHTLAYALNDSPLGQLAWIAEKYAAWTDSDDGRPDTAIGRDRLLANVSLYWFTGTGGSSAQWYLEMMRESSWDSGDDGASWERGAADDESASWDSGDAGSDAWGEDSGDWAAAARGTVPTGVLVSKAKDITIRRWAERDHNVTHWAEYDHGGHFFAAEQPELFAADVRTFFHSVR